MFIIPQAREVFLCSVFVFCLWQHEDFPVPQTTLLSGGLHETQLHFNLLYAKALLPISPSLCWTFPLTPCSRTWVTLKSLIKFLLAPGVSSSLPFLRHPWSLFNQAFSYLTMNIVASSTLLKVVSFLS